LDKKPAKTSRVKLEIELIFLLKLLIKKNIILVYNFIKLKLYLQTNQTLEKTISRAFGAFRTAQSEAKILKKEKEAKILTEKKESCKHRFYRKKHILALICFCH
jgi:hypothetical protein